MKHKIIDILERETRGKSYKAHKYGLDYAERPLIDYGNNTIKWKKSAETDKHINYVNLIEKSKTIAKFDEQLLTFFLDGSRKVFKVDDMSYEQQRGRSVIFPIVAGQIGVGCCKRVKGRMVPEEFIQDFVISVPDIADADGINGFFPSVVIKINASTDLQKNSIKISKILEYNTGQNDTKFEDRGTARIQEHMIELEKQLVAKLVKQNKLNQNNYLVKDGSLEYKPTIEEKNDKKKYQMMKNNYNWVLGVSKNFNPEICKDVNGKSNPGFIADLPLYYRTPVSCYESDFIGDYIQFAVWYIRIRDKNRTNAPFDGVIKVEKILVTEEEINCGIDSDLVDTLSAHIINERNPTCYGTDIRWANHLYPIYLTELFVKSRYISTESFLHMF